MGKIETAQDGPNACWFAFYNGFYAWGNTEQEAIERLKAKLPIEVLQEIGDGE